MVSKKLYTLMCIIMSSKTDSVIFLNVIIQCFEHQKWNSIHLYCFEVATENSEMDIWKPQTTS